MEQQPHIELIVIHCTATAKNATVNSILHYWKNVLHWEKVGYHYMIDEDGCVLQLEDEMIPVNGVKGYNRNSIHVATIGGMKKDDRTIEQKQALHRLVNGLVSQYPNAKIVSHHSLNPHKECPRYSAEEEFKYLIKSKS